MLKRSLLRHAALRPVAVSSRLTSFASNITANPVARRLQPAVSSATLYGPLVSTARLYSNSSAASALSGKPSELPLTEFEQLHDLNVTERLVNTITHRLQYKTMTDVQSMTIVPALSGKDLVAQAKTGTGKTLAFLVPIIERILKENPDLERMRDREFRPRARPSDIRAIVISPTRELAEQIGVEARRLTQGTGIVVQTAVGGTQKGRMLRQTRVQGCHIMIATPGRLNDLISDPSSGISAPKLQALVLDEADRMLDVGFEKELNQIIDCLPRRDEVPRQTLLFSATMPKNVVQIARTYIDSSNFEFIQTISADDAPTHEKVPQYIVPCKSMANLQPSLLELMLREVDAAESDPTALPFKAIVFLPTTALVELTGELFTRLQRKYRQIPRIWSIQSKLSQAARTSAAEGFRRARSGVLFSSDVTARGMDFPNVTHVIQLGLPPSRDQYIHRLGRTGRADKNGQGWLLISDVELEAARSRLGGLPIQPHKGLKAPSVRPSDNSTLTDAFADIQSAAEGLPHEMMDSAYTSLLGGAAVGIRDRQRLVDNANEMATYMLGMQSPPAISRSLAQNTGLIRLRGINVRSQERRGSFDERRGPYERRGRDSQRFDRRPSRDQFDMMEQRTESRSKFGRASASF